MVTTECRDSLWDTTDERDSGELCDQKATDSSVGEILIFQNGTLGMFGFCF